MAEVKQQADGLRSACNTDALPAPALATFVGVFANDLYGDIAVTLEDDRLRLAYGQLTATLEPCQPASFIARWDLKGLADDAYITFTADAQTLTLVNDRATYQRK
jgi:hypothetical protein